MVFIPQAAFKQALLAKTASPWFLGICELWTPLQPSFSVLESYLWEFLLCLREADTPQTSPRELISLFSCKEGKTPGVKQSDLKCDV